MSFAISDVSYSFSSATQNISANSPGARLWGIEISNDGSTVVTANAQGPNFDGYLETYQNDSYLGAVAGIKQGGIYLSLSSNGLAVSKDGHLNRNNNPKSPSVHYYYRSDLTSDWIQIENTGLIGSVHKMSGDGLSLVDASGSSLRLWKRNTIDASFGYSSDITNSVSGVVNNAFFAISEDGKKVFAKNILYDLTDINSIDSYSISTSITNGNILYGHLSKNGKRVVLGINTSSTAINLSDRVEVYELIASSWVQVGQTIEENISHEGDTNDDSQDDEDQTGAPCMLSGDGNTLVVSAINYRDTVGAQSRGRVRVFKYYHKRWNEVGFVDGPQHVTDNPSYARFGKYVNVNYNGSRFVLTESYDYNIAQYAKTHIYDIENVISNICFPAGELVLTDAGYKTIEKVTTADTIRSKPIEAITQTQTNDSYVIKIPKDSFYTNMPNKNTIITQNHKVLYKGKMIHAQNLLAEKIGCKKIKYNKEILYNILLEEEGKMVVNNMIVETLSPTNSIARLYKMLDGKTLKDRTELIQGYKKYVDENGQYKGP